MHEIVYTFKGPIILFNIYMRQYACTTRSSMPYSVIATLYDTCRLVSQKSGWFPNKLISRTRVFIKSNLRLQVIIIFIIFNKTKKEMLSNHLLILLICFYKLFENTHRHCVVVATNGKLPASHPTATAIRRLSKKHRTGVCILLFRSSLPYNDLFLCSAHILWLGFGDG